MARGFDRAELEAPADEAVAAAREAGYDNLPHNVLNHGPLCGECWAYKGRSYEEGAPYRRFAGFLRRMIEVRPRGLDRLIAKTASQKGIGSKHNHISLWAVAERQGSPEAANRSFFRVRRRANEILAPYGLRVSYAGLAQALATERRIGKAAFIAAEETARSRFYAVTGTHVTYSRRGADRFAGLKAVRGWQALKRDWDGCPAGISWAASAWVGHKVAAGEFNSIREALAVVQERVMERTDDGITVAIDRNDPVIRRFGLEMYRTYRTQGRRRQSSQEGYLVVNPATGETYHAYRYSGKGDAQEVRYILRQATVAWKRQRIVTAEKRQKHEQIVQVLEGTTVTIEDSLAAGNCRIGTVNWMERHGLGGQKEAPASVLLPHLDDPRVMNVARVVLRRVQQSA